MNNFQENETQTVSLDDVAKLIQRLERGAGPSDIDEAAVQLTALSRLVKELREQIEKLN